MFLLLLASVCYIAASSNHELERRMHFTGNISLLLCSSPSPSFTGQEHQSTEPHTPSTSVTPPIFPPTPDHTPITGDREFFSSYETTISTEYQETNPIFTSALHSPGFTTLTDTFCDSFFKHELSNYRSSCSSAMSLPLSAKDHVPPFFDNTPLTPQSSHFSSSSPLSHSSLQSPEPSAELEITQQQSSCRSPDSGMYPRTAADTQSASSPSDNCGLDIAASLELVAEGTCATAIPPSTYDYIQQDSTVASPFSNCCSPQIPSHNGTHPYTAYSQYEFDLLQLMSSPDDLLVDSLMQNPASTTPIH